jgi:hypothetical protein
LAWGLFENKEGRRKAIFGEEYIEDILLLPECLNTNMKK